ncbi:hypothetical protein SAMN04489844_3040 [Nocardioides exalbidus]|uniref:PQQ-like domain-containing protein n=1 Tax=Nocardioides exalbidus TaxID=402596 RepID=A0A1H4VJN9_9ACTN|nr:hypothetical protein [Nocardioides exalbidus]SEC81309.1 hypothetical protein SAMN04489844_3040 [Nocardioides exalbidus]
MARTSGSLAALLSAVITAALTAALAAAVLTTPPTASASGSSVAASAPGAAAQLPREIRGGVELTLVDGDLLRVWAAKRYRTVWAQRRDAATGTWGERTVVLERRNLYCGDVDARTANGAVAVIAKCDRSGYYEDQAPTASRAIWSADAVTWSSRELEGEAYEEPGISPDGLNAVWPQYGGYLTRTPAGFAAHRLDATGQEYTVTATISDAEQVSFMYGAAASRGRRCGLVVLTRTGDAAPVRRDVPLADACTDSSLANLDSTTVWFGDLSGPAGRAVISRPDDTAPWAVTAVAPSSAPGLVDREHGLYRDFFTAPGFPLIAVGGGPGGVVQAQLYDAAAQAWGAPAVVLDPPGRCSWGDNWTADPMAVVAVRLRCSGRGLVLTTRDGVAWQVLRSGRHPVGLSPDARYVAVPGRTRTHVISPERGVVTLPGGVTGRCDVVVPDGPDGAVLLTAASRHRGWPTVLQHSTATGWTRLSRVRLPTPDVACRKATASTFDVPYRFALLGRHDRGYAVRIVRVGDTWTVRRSRW